VITYWREGVLIDPLQAKDLHGSGGTIIFSLFIVTLQDEYLQMLF